MSSNNALTFGRAMALFAIALTAAGLVALHLGGPSRVRVPSSARAGDLTLVRCTYAGLPADCGALIVPENRHDPRTRMIALPITRIHATTVHPGAPIFRLQGGPGITNMDFPDARRFTNAHDVVLVGYRGVDGSSPLDCPEVAHARAHSRDFLAPSSFDADASAYSKCVRRLEGSGVDLAGYTLPERVDDLELARRKLGYGRIDLVSESAGTRTAMIYAWRYPASIHRSVMIGANPPGNFLWNSEITGEQIERYAVLCAAAPDCHARTADLAAAVRSAYRRVPGHWWFLPIKKGNVRVAGFFGLMDETNDGGGPLAATRTLDTLRSIDAGDGAAGAWLFSLFSELAFPNGQVWGDVAAVGRADSAYAKRYFARHEDTASSIGAPATDLLTARGKLFGVWPKSPDDDEYARVRRSDVPTLLVNGALDFATPPQLAARELLPSLTRARQVVLPNLGHTGDFWSYEPDASTRLIERYLATGRVDTSLYTRNRIDFTPSFTHAMVAEIVLGSLLGLAVLALILSVWLCARLRRRAELGGKARVAVRALVAPLVGLGAFCAAALVAMAAAPTLPLTGMLVGVAATAPFVALAVHAGAEAFGRRGAFAGVLSGALLGGWLGFHAPRSPGLGAATAIVGATLGANLLLLALEMTNVLPRATRSVIVEPAAFTGG